MKINTNQKEYYQYLLKQAVETQSKDLFNIIPRNIYEIKTDEKDIVSYLSNNNLFAIKYIIFVSNNLPILKDIMILAIQYGQLDIVKYLIENGTYTTSQKNSYLSLASAMGYLDVVKYLNKKGASICANNNNSLLLASGMGHLEIVKYLVENGADVDSRHNKSLREARRNGHLNVEQYLVENGADASSKDNKPLREASRHLYIVK